MRYFTLMLMCITSVSCVEFLRWNKNYVVGTTSELHQPGVKVFTSSLANLRTVSDKMKGLCVLQNVMEKLSGEEAWTSSTAMGKALVWVNLDGHHLQQSVDYDWLLEFNQEFPLRGLDFIEIICTDGKADMKLRSGRKMLELPFVLK